MGFLTSLFGGDNSLVTVLIALAVVIVLIVLAVWALKLVFSASGRVARGRNKRLAVIDFTAVDQKRQLVLIRRDGVEHLLMIGGPQDLVVESGIVREVEPAAAEPARPPRRGVPPIVQQRPAPAPEPAAPAAAEPEKPAAALGSLDDLGKPLADRKRPLLRQTGLLRPLARTEPPLIPIVKENSEPPLTDSGKNTAGQGAATGPFAEQVLVQPDNGDKGELRAVRGEK